jgi:hypothetical protein
MDPYWHQAPVLCVRLARWGAFFEMSLTLHNPHTDACFFCFAIRRHVCSQRPEKEIVYQEHVLEYTNDHPPEDNNPQSLLTYAIKRLSA